MIPRFSRRFEIAARRAPRARTGAGAIAMKRQQSQGLDEEILHERCARLGQCFRCGAGCQRPELSATAAHAKLELNRLASGAVLKVTATDAGSQRDFRVFAQLAGHGLLHEEAEAGVYRYWLRKA